MPGGRRPSLERAFCELAAVRLVVGHRRPLSLDEAIHVAGQLSRRDLLRMAGVAGAGLLLAGCTPDEGSATPIPTSGAGSPRIVIVGAGLAGLTAAYRLGQAGLGCRVFEARDRVGGRCWSARAFAGRQVGEHGGEFIDTRHVHLRLLAEELGLQLDDLQESWLPGATWLSYVDGELVRPGSLFAEMDVAIGDLVELAGTGSYFPGEAAPDLVALDAQTEATWFRENVGSTDAATYRLWAANQAGWYGLDPDALSAANLIDFYATGTPGADERYTIHGGNDQLPARILEELPEGTITLEAPLEAIRTRDDGASELVFAGVAEPVIADRVILTLPFTLLRNLDLSQTGFSEAKLRAIRELGMGTNAKVLLQFDRPFYSGFGDWSGGLQRGDEPVIGTWESGSTDGAGADRYGLLTVYSGGRQGATYPVEEPHAEAPVPVVRDTLAAIDAAVPGVSAAYAGTAWLDAWAYDPWVGGSYAAFTPGQVTSFWGLTGEPEGSVHFAGEHTSTFSQGYLNGGVESGSRAAAEVLAVLGLPPPPELRRTFRVARRFAPRYPWQQS